MNRDAEMYRVCSVMRGGLRDRKCMRIRSHERRRREVDSLWSPSCPLLATMTRGKIDKRTRQSNSTYRLTYQITADTYLFLLQSRKVPVGHTCRTCSPSARPWACFAGQSPGNTNSLHPRRHVSYSAASYSLAGRLRNAAACVICTSSWSSYPNTRPEAAT